MATQQRKQQHAMSISPQDLEFIKSQFVIWNQESNHNPHYDKELHERSIRVQEELSTQRQLIEQRFDHMDKRFEQVDKRFEQVNKRFEQVDEQLRLQREDMNRRFEQVDKQFAQVDKRFEQVDKRFEQVDKRFEQVDKRFEQVDQRFEKLFQHLRWYISALLASCGLMFAALRYLS